MFYPGNLVAKSLPTSTQRGASPGDRSYRSELTAVGYSESDEEYDVVQREETNLTPSIARQRSYGAVPDVHAVPRRKRKGNRGRAGYRHSTSVVSVSDFREMFGSYKRLEDVVEGSVEEDSEDEEPPIIEMIYRRNCKDKTKLILLPFLYFTFMVLAGVFAFYSIGALIDSYRNRVRSVHDYHVQSYDPIGIAVFLEDFGTFHDCSFKYNDDLFPVHGNFTPVRPAKNCTYRFVTFSSALIGSNRTAMVFRGPTGLKESVALNLSVNTSLRQFGAIEFMLLESWDSVERPDAPQALARTEAKSPLYTVPAGFRTWIKMSKTVYENNKEHGILLDHDVDFTLNFAFSVYNNWRAIVNQTTNVVYVLFEWKDDKYTYIKEILSTNLWNTVGSLAGIFVAMYKAGELCTAWLKRIRRERRKKLAKLQELEEQQRRLMEEYSERKKEKEERKQSEKKDSLRLSPVKENVPQRVTPHRNIPRRLPEDM